jgi:hypothetical protein
LIRASGTMRRQKGFWRRGGRGQVPGDGVVVDLSPTAG